MTTNKNVNKHILADMAVRKLFAPTIFDGYKCITDHVLVLDDGIIETIIPVTEAGEDVEYFEGTLTPGFINCHCHLELSHMKGVIPEKIGLVDFVWTVVSQRDESDTDVLAAMKEWDEEMYEGGIQAVGDICNLAISIPLKQNSSINYHNFVETSGWLPGIASVRFEKILTVYNAFSKELPGSGLSLVPHAPYSVSESLWEQIRPLFRDKIVSIHNQETEGENEFFVKGSGEMNRMYEIMGIGNDHHAPTGLSSVQSYFQHLAQANKILLVHNSFTSAEDVDFIVRNSEANNNQTFFCICINANQYIEDAVPPLDIFLEKNVDIVLGTDSLASNKTLSIADEMATIKKLFPDIKLDEILKWATINGAKALNMEERLGSFEKGKNPGVIHLMKEFKVKRIC